MGTGGIWTVDLSVLSHPVLVPGGNLALGALAWSVVLNGNYAYVADGVNGLKVVDVTNPGAPRVLGTKSLGNARDLAVVGSLAYVADTTWNLYVLNVATPSAPVVLGSAALSGAGTHVAVAGTQAAVIAESTSSSLLQIVDVSAPSTPAVQGSVSLGAGGTGQGVAMTPGVAYAGIGLGGLQIYGASGAPVMSGDFSNTFTPTSIAMANGMAFIAGGAAGTALLDVVNLAIPTQPTVLGRLTTSANSSFFGVAVNSTGTLAVVSLGNAGIWTVSTSPPANPIRLGSLAIGALAWGVALNGNYAYVADGVNGLKVVDVTNPGAPSLAGSKSLGNARDVAVAGSLAYVADTTWNLYVLNVGTPSAPGVLGSIALSGAGTRVAVAGTQAAVIAEASNSMLQIVDVSSSSAPVIKSTVTLGPGGTGQGVAMTPGYVYVATTNLGLKIFNVSNPTLPVLVNQVPLIGKGLGVAVQGNLAAVADSPATIDVITLGP
jgi:hypothetical protein